MVTDSVSAGNGLCLNEWFHCACYQWWCKNSSHRCYASLCFVTGRARLAVLIRLNCIVIQRCKCTSTLAYSSLLNIWPTHREHAVMENIRYVVLNVMGSQKIVQTFEQCPNGKGRGKLSFLVFDGVPFIDRQTSTQNGSLRIYCSGKGIRISSIGAFGM